MRRPYPFIILLSGSLICAACSKKADTAPSGESTESASSPVDVEASAPEPTTAEQDSGITFSLSGSPKESAAPGSTSPRANSAPAADGFTPAQQLDAIYPFYPLSLRMRGIEGRVEVRVDIDAQGRVTNAQVLRSTEQRFTPYALEAARAVRFAPAMEKGKPVAMSGVLNIPFISELGSGGLAADSILARLAYIDGLYYMKDGTGKTVPANTKEPFRLSIVTPFPEGAKPGEVLKANVRVSISEEGQVTDVSVKNATTPAFETALKEVAPFWQFVPQLKDGKPMPGKVEFPFTVTMPR